MNSEEAYAEYANDEGQQNWNQPFIHYFIQISRTPPHRKSVLPNCG